MNTTIPPLQKAEEIYRYFLLQMPQVTNEGAVKSKQTAKNNAMYCVELIIHTLGNLNGSFPDAVSSYWKAVVYHLIKL